MEGLLESTLLYDFYGELLTQHQRDIYEDFALNDLSLGEIAQNRGISRQAVYDIVKRCRKQLDFYEEKLHLVSKFSEEKKDIRLIGEYAKSILEDSGISRNSYECASGIVRLAGSLSKEL